MTEIEQLRAEIAALRQEIAGLRYAIYPTWLPLQMPVVSTPAPKGPHLWPGYPMPYTTCVGGTDASASHGPNSL